MNPIVSVQLATSDKYDVYLKATADGEDLEDIEATLRRMLESPDEYAVGVKPPSRSVALDLKRRAKRRKQAIDERESAKLVGAPA